MSETYYSRVYTERPPYADFDAPRREIARLQAELEALENCLEEGEENQYGPDGAAP